MKISRQIFSLVFVFLIATPILATNLPTQPDQTTHKSNDKQSFIIGDLIKAHLEQLAKNYAVKGYRSDFTIGKIDPYHAKKNCNQVPELTINRQPLTQNRITTEIRCEGPKPWKLYISSKFDLYAKTVVASTNIRRGQIIQEDDLTLQETVINKTHYSQYYQLRDVVGMVAKRSIRSDSSIQPSHLTPPKLVKRGDNVVIVARNSAISVRMNGKALSDGSLGQQIPVQNSQSKRVVKARVSKAGLVTIML